MNIKIPADLITVNCNNIEAGKKALEYSSKSIEFNNIYFFTDKNINGNFEPVKISKISGVSEYNSFMLKLNEFITSPFVLVIQDDGHIINPNLWDDNFLNYDYIGAPWPNDQKWNRRWEKYGEEICNKIQKHSTYNQIGNGGFSLRSKKFLEYSSIFDSTGVLGEDIFLTLYNFDLAKDNNINFPSVDLAKKFSYETPLKGTIISKEKKNQYFDKSKHFGWHGKKFKNSDELMSAKYV